MNYWIVIPLVSALIGWLGTLIAGKLLVRKIIAQKHVLAQQVGEKLAAGFSLDSISKKLSSPDTISKIMPVVETHIDDFLRHKLKAKMPMIGMLIGDKTISSLKEIFLKEIEDMFPQVMDKFSENLGSELDIQKMAADKINSITPAEITKTLTPVTSYFGWAGAIIGLIIGLVNTGLFLAFK